MEFDLLAPIQAIVCSKQALPNIFHLNLTPAIYFNRQNHNKNCEALVSLSWSIRYTSDE